MVAEILKMISQRNIKAKSNKSLRKSTGLLILDTGFFIALFNKNDFFHERALNAAKLCNECEWITSWAVITELCHVLPVGAISSLLKDHLSGLFKIFTLSEKHIPRIIELLNKYESLDFADATLVIIAEDIQCGDILSVDERDFCRLRWGPGHKKFRNLLIS